MTHSGGCHCGRIAFDVEMDLGKVISCNCSICTKRGYLLAVAPADKVTLRTPESDMSTYTFNTHRIRHLFCPTCGVGPLGRSTSPEGVDTYAINVRCLDGVDLAALDIQPHDGRSS
jgi:hypothetical protein